MAIPFVLAAVLIERFIVVFQRMKSGMAWVSRISGALLVIVAILMLTDYLTVITGVLQAWTPAALKSRL